MPSHYQKKSIPLFLTISVLALFAACREPLPVPKDYNLTCYAASYAKGIYRTDNGGRSWFPLDLDQTDLYAYFKRIYQDPRHKSTLYITTTGAGLFRIETNSLTLSTMNGFEGKTVSSVTFAASYLFEEESREEMLAATNGSGILRTCEVSDSWLLCNQGLIYREVNVLFSHEDLLLAGTAKDLFKWDEKAIEWVPASEGIQNKNILSLGADSAAKTLYAGSGAYDGERSFFQEIPCLSKSTDQGKTWFPCDEGIPDGTLVFTISVNPGRPERIYLGTSDGLYRSTDAGGQWSQMEHGLPKALNVFDIKMARMPDGEDVVYAATSVGIFVTTDDDETRWVRRNYGLEPTAVTSLLLVPK
jgi:photosystem II stability/assembly factor-like uncharacterized protein